MGNIDLAVIIPCHNEGVNIAETIEGIESNLKTIKNYKIFVIDNNSTDDTSQVAKSAGAIVIFEPRIGKGYAILKAFAQIEAPFYIMMDGDNTYDTRVIDKIVVKLQSGCDHVIVCRKNIFSDRNNRKFHNLGNWVFTLLSNFVTGLRIRDSLSGYRGFSRRFVKSFSYHAKGFEVETFLNFHSKITESKIIELEGQYFQRKHGSMSKLNTFRDGFKIIGVLGRIFSEIRPGFGTILIAAVNFLLALYLVNFHLDFFRLWFNLFIVFQILILISVVLKRINNSTLNPIRENFYKS